MSWVIGDWDAGRLELARAGLLRCAGVRRELRLPPGSPPVPPLELGEAIKWSGEFSIQIFSRRRGQLRRLVGYCRRGDAWTSDPRAVFD
jgi:hypothetical protein